MYTAALLHDVGKMVLGRYVKDDIINFDTATMDALSFEQVERNMFGTDHAEVGAAILKRWSFPLLMIDAVRWHHEPDDSPKPSQMIDVVHVADVMCLMTGIGIGREGLQYEVSRTASERLGVTEKIIEKTASLTLQWTNELASTLQGS